MTLTSHTVAFMDTGLHRANAALPDLLLIKNRVVDLLRTASSICS